MLLRSEFYEALEKGVNASPEEACLNGMPSKYPQFIGSDADTAKSESAEAHLEEAKQNAILVGPKRISIYGHLMIDDGSDSSPTHDKCVPESSI